MEHRPFAAAVATAVAGRDRQQLESLLTPSVRLRALLPGGPVEERGRHDVAARFHGFFAAFDTAELVEATGEAVADRLLIHYRLHVTRGDTRWVCTQTSICTIVDGRLAVIDLLCSGFREVSHGRVELVG